MGGSSLPFRGHRTAFKVLRREIMNKEAVGCRQEARLIARVRREPDRHLRHASGSTGDCTT